MSQQEDNILDFLFIIIAMELIALATIIIISLFI